MIDVPHAPADRCFDLSESGVRMPRVESHPSVAVGPHEPLRVCDLRGNGYHQWHRRGEAHECLRIPLVWCNEVLIRVTAARRASEVWAIKVASDNSGAAGHITVQLMAKFEELQILVHPGDGAGRR